MSDRADDTTFIDGSWKGVPGAQGGLRIEDIGSRGWNVLAEDLPLPLAIIRQSALDHNIAWMQRLLAYSNAVEAPHGKTAMAPTLVQRQIDAGAWGVTVSSVFQAEVHWRNGIRRILIANQIVSKAAAEALAHLLAKDEELEIMVLVDSPAAVDRLTDLLSSQMLARPLDVLLEVGVDGGRTGCTTVDLALETARKVHQSGSTLRLRGIEGYEGVIVDPDEPEQRVRDFLDRLSNVARACMKENLIEPEPMVFSAGGSVYIDLVLDWWRQNWAQSQSQLLVQTGSYVLCDGVIYPPVFRRMVERSPWIADLGEGPRPAIELWSYVQSRPSPTQATLTMGLRDSSDGSGLPVARSWFRLGQHTSPQPIGKGHTILELNDQHAILACPEDTELQVGDMVMSDVCYPCGTTDKWRLLLEVDDQYRVVKGHPTFF